MTVAELVERLRELPGELTVQIADSEYGPCDVSAADIEDHAGPRAVVIR